MAEATEIRGNSVTPSTDAAKTEPLSKSQGIAKPKAAAKVEASAKPEAAAESAIVAEVRTARTGGAAGWMGKMRTSIAAAVPSNRAALLAAGIGFVAGAGLLMGTVGVMGVGGLLAATAPERASSIATIEETRALKQTVAKLEAQVVGLKANIDAANRQSKTQRSQITDRYERSERTQSEMQTRLIKIGDALERLEKRVVAVAAAEATGSVAPRYAAEAAAVATAAKTPPEPPIATGWVIRDVFRGRALVASRRGVFEAAPGLFLPELGRVETVTRKNGRWVVVAEKGMITTMRRPRATHSYDAD